MPGSRLLSAQSPVLGRNWPPGSSAAPQFWGAGGGVRHCSPWCLRGRPGSETRFASGGRTVSLQDGGHFSGHQSQAQSPLASPQPGLQDNVPLSAGPWACAAFLECSLIPGWPSWVWKSSGGLPLKSQPQAGGANRRVGHGGHSPAAPLSASILCSTRACSEDETPQAQGFALFGNILGRPRLEGGKEGMGLGGPQMSRLLHH